MRILRTHLSAASSDGFRGGSVFKAWKQSRCFSPSREKKKKERGRKRKNDDCTRQSVSGPGGTDATQTKICSIFQGYGNESQM